MSNAEIKVGQKWIATKDVAGWKAGIVAEIIETGERIRFKSSYGQEEFIFNNPEDVVWFKSVYKLVVTDQVNEEMGAAESLRNSVLDIRSKREALQKELLQLDEQEKEAIEKLKELGFLLANDPFEEGSSFCVEVGDIVRCISVENPGYGIGGLGTSLDVLYTVEHVFGEVDGKQKVSIEERAGGIGLVGVNYEFHSRPVK